MTNVRTTPRLRRGYLLVLLAAFLYGASGNAVKLLFRLGYSPLLMAQLRISFAFLWLVGGLLLFRPTLLRVPTREVIGLAAFGVFAIAAVQLTYYLAIARVNIAVAVFVQYLGLVGVTAWERYRRQQQVSRQVWLALGLVLIGSFFMVGAYQPSLLRVNGPGLLLSLVAACFFALFLLRASTLVQRIDRWTVLLYGFGAGTLAWLGVDVVTRPVFPQRLGIWAAMVTIGLLGTLLPFGFEVAALRTLRPSRVGIVATAEPVFAGLIAFGLGDLLEPLQMLGAVLVMAGIVLVQAGPDDADVMTTAIPS